MNTLRSTLVGTALTTLLVACSLINAPENLEPSSAGAGGTSSGGSSGKGGSAPGGQAGTVANAGSPAEAGEGGMPGAAGEAGSGPVGGMCSDSEADCSGTAPICDETLHSCRACAGDPDCSVLSDTPFCTAAGRCVACKKDVDCSGRTPVCGSAGTCRACNANADCASGVCNPNGACGATAGAVYVLASTGSTQATCGAFEEPCRFIATAAPKLTAARSNLVFLATQQAFDTGGAVIPPLEGIRVIGNGVVVQPYDGATSFKVTGGSVSFEGVDVRGGAAAAPGLNCTGGTVHVRNSHFKGNGVAVNATDCSITITDSVIEENATPLSNGLVAINASCSNATCTATLTVERSRIQGNGKALYVTNNATVLRNNLWLDNGDTGNSGAYNRVLEFRGKTAQVAYNTFVGNFNSCSYVGLLACDSGTCDALGNITWGNFPGQSCNDQVLYNFQSMTYNLTEALQPGVGNRSGDPKFVNPAGRDYTPGAGSPALDNGSPTSAPADDYNGKPRPVGGAPDIGAVEAQ